MTTSAPQKPKENDKTAAKTLIIDKPIRAGSQVYAKNADLIVTGSVNPGAEILADGNIHVYGALRGRALAGIQGDLNARIFAKEIEAELVSIAGFYTMDKTLAQPSAPKAMHHIFLKDKQICIEGI